MRTLPRPILSARLAIGLAALLMMPGLALAHASKSGTVPAAGATLAQAPAKIEMMFDSPIRVTLVQLTRADGERYDVDYVRGEPVTHFRATPASLPSGNYTVDWRGLSDDGHPTSGSFSFTID